MTDFFQIYDTLLGDIPGDIPIWGQQSCDWWTGVENREGLGLAMTVPWDSVPCQLPGKAAHLRQLAEGCKSWNLREAGFGMAAVNAWYNTPARLEALRAWEPFENYCTRGLDVTGKHVALVGHLRLPEEALRGAASVRILERAPQTGDYPDSACDWLLPQCDIVLITASTLVNKTLPHLLELCKDAYTILTGPTCPMCPQLLNLGIQRLSGLVVTQREGMKRKIRENEPGSPYPMGVPFLLTEDGL